MDERTLQKKLKFIDTYKKAVNAATGSEVDSNANVTSKNVATMSTELSKPDFIYINRAITKRYLLQKYGQELCDKFDEDLKQHIIYSHDETSVMPYTYSSKEVVYVKYRGQSLLLSLGQLYDYVDVVESVLDETNEVFGKFPNDLQILDKDGWTNVTRLIRKKRHRDLVRVKTSFGEDIVVTDNHPLIISDDKNNTVDAIDSLGEKQFKRTQLIKWDEHLFLDAEKICENMIIERYENGFTVQNDKWCKVFYSPNKIELTEELGYLVGFFIGDGCYNSYTTTAIQITQNNKSILKKLADIAIKYFNATPMIRGDESSKYDLWLYSPVMLKVFHDVFKIGNYAQNKTLPVNIFETNKDFAKGLIWGLVDSDGTTHDGTISIRVSSRTLINQLVWLMKDFGYTLGTTINERQVGFKDQLAKGYNQNYTIWGVSATVTNESLLCEYSYKSANIKVNNKRLKYSDGWVNISNVQTLQTGKFVDEQNEFIYDITTESNSFLCNNLWVHNCCAITLYPFLLYGLKALGGTSGPPKHSDSFVGGLTNLIFLIAGQFAGAVAVPETLPYLDHFLRADYGDDYTQRLDEVVESFGNRRATLRTKIEDLFQQFVYCVNQPAAARGYQSPFTNIAYFDKGYFEAIFKDFVFPDGDEPNYESTKALQKMFMKWFNKERLHDTLTFPVETMNLLHNGNTFVDEDMADFTAEMWSEGHSFFLYNSDSADALSSCCRLRNSIEENVFSYTLGAGGVETGSKKVITLNINRIVQNWFNDEVNKKYKRNRKSLPEYISEIVDRVHKYLEAWNDWLWELYDAGMLTVYSAGFMDLNKQYLTIGINGFLEGAEFLSTVNEFIPKEYQNIETKPTNEAYKNYTRDILNTIKELNIAHRTSNLKYNTELVPAENAGHKLYEWDKKDGYWVPKDRSLYNSYFYPVEDTSYDPVTKMFLQGKDFIGNLDGGSAYHCNLDSHLSKEQYRKLMDIAIQSGCSYFTFNIPNTICDECGHIDKRYLHECPECGSENVDYATRVIGYLKRVSNFSQARQIEADKRFYSKDVGC